MDNHRRPVLLVEDHQPTRTFLSENLTADGYLVLEAGTAARAIQILETSDVQLAVIDLGLPDRDGFELLRDVRDAGSSGRIDANLPLLVLSGRVGELDRVRGFQRGCDDYVVKPFSYPELEARIGALLRRGPRHDSPVGRLRAGPVEIDQVGRRVWVAGEPLALSKKEFALLRALAAEPTRVLTREELLRGVWGFQSLGATRTLDSHASRLRRKLRACGVEMVVNVWGVGYRLLDGACR